jgi:hypothetical protein
MGFAVIVGIIPMASNGTPQFVRQVFSQQSNVAAGEAGDAAVRQDKGVLTNAPVASAQPAPLPNPARPQPLSTNVHRANKRDSTKVKLIHTTLHLHPLVRAELERRAGQEFLSVSRVGATLLETAIRQDINSQYQSLQQPILRQIIREELRAFGNRVVFFLMRIAFASEQARILVTNVLERILKKEGVDNKRFHELVDQSNQLARRNIIQKTPQLKRLLAEWEGVFPEEEQGTGNR